MSDETLIERVKRRAMFRRQDYAPGRYVRFEKHIDAKLKTMSDKTNVEAAELVRILVDEALERRGLKPIRDVDPKAPAAMGDPTRYVPLAELGVTA